MPTKDGYGRPRAGLGLGSQMKGDAVNKRAAKNKSAKPARNRNVVKTPTVGRREK